MALIGWILAITLGLVLVMIWKIEYHHGERFFKTKGEK